MGNLHSPQRESIESIVNMFYRSNPGGVPPMFWPSELPNYSWRFYIENGSTLILSGISRTTAHNPSNRESAAVFMVRKGEERSVTIPIEEMWECRFAVLLYTDGRNDHQGEPWRGGRKVVLLEPVKVAADLTLFQLTEWSAGYNPTVTSPG